VAICAQVATNLSLSLVTAGCHDNDGQQQQQQGLDGYVFLMAVSVTLFVISISSITAVVICWRRLYKR